MRLVQLGGRGAISGLEGLQCKLSCSGRRGAGRVGLDVFLPGLQAALRADIPVRALQWVKHLRE